MKQCPSHTMPPEPASDLAGKEYWRSLDDLADTPEFREFVEREFPDRADEWLGGRMGRRKFLTLMAASIGLAGLAGCRRPEIEILPYSRKPESVVPGLPTYYCTTIPRSRSPLGVLVESHEGRPTKIEGNPNHPLSLGSTDAQAQAEVLGLYDPDRSRQVLHDGKPSTWTDFESRAENLFAKLRQKKGKGLHFLSRDPSSPAWSLLQEHTSKVFPEARWHFHEPAGDDHVVQGGEHAFGTPSRPFVDLEKAERILALDWDGFGTDENATQHIRDFAKGRRPDAKSSTMSRLYVVENHPTTTGAMADHRLRLPASAIGEYLVVLAQEILRSSSNEKDQADSARVTPVLDVLQQTQTTYPFPPEWIREVAAELLAFRGKGVIVVGSRQPSWVHALAYLLNEVLDNKDRTIRFYPVVRRNATSVLELANDIRKGAVDTLVILGGNPVYDAPADLDFAALLKKIPNTIRLGLHEDETSAACRWHLPEAHWLESWGDAEAIDGTYSPVQPLIATLYAGRSALEILAFLSSYETKQAYEIVLRSFAKQVGATDVKKAFRQFLHDGILANNARKPLVRKVNHATVTRAIKAARKVSVPVGADNLEVVFHADFKVSDGRFANNGWLQELPDPITKLTWDNAALVSPRTAEHLRVKQGDVITLRLADRSVQAPVFVLPGQADESISLPLGYGRTRAGRIGTGVGFDAYRLRTTSALHFATGVQVSKTNKRHEFACTQDHGSMQGRDLIREWTLPEYQEHLQEEKHGAAKHGHDGRLSLDLAPPPELDGKHQWGMTIDLNLCVGCSACVVACQSENNIPIVGKEEVQRNREMHWIRVDRYFKGTEEDPELAFQPVACVHCEDAPCETVCPVNAAVHSPEGLNLQVYNRCIGTRYCANNCPYKVRRFNWFDYNQRPLDQLELGPLAEKGMAETLKMQKNPDVSVRMRGVMEKCTYCVQRIERGKAGATVRAGTSGKYHIPDGTVTPACAQACPAQAILFGDLSDPTSRVSQAKRDRRDYGLLHELGTKPRTSHQARLRNPNPRMKQAEDRDTKGGEE